MRTIKRILTIALGCGVLFGAATPAVAAKKQPLKVLYVGGATDVYQPQPGQTDSLRLVRTASFYNLLSEYFTKVDTIWGAEYSPEMSKNYDVTVLDGNPKELTPRIMERNSAGEIISYSAATYLPADYDCATVTVGSVGNAVGRSIGVKNDWYCLCLDAQAHHWVKDHPIFKGPFKTKMTVEECPTPEDAYHYKYYYDGPIPDKLPMWRVQTKGYQDTHGFPIGMVARPWGYTDSPDAEYISSGVCAKTLDAVAIGRHGNFLHWGFAASPAYMTPEAKVVFANAVAYISKFNGQKIQARKFNDRIATREYLKEIAYLVTPEYNEERNVEDSIWTLQRKKEYDKLAAKKAKGEKLSSDEESMLRYGDPGEFKRRSHDDMAKRYGGNFYEMFGTDAEAYARYFKENYKYFYSEGFYHIFVDEDVKTWGIDNHDTALLDRAISCLEKGEETDRAKRILARYTMADFETAAQWREWFNKYRDKMYFTESGGWHFLIDGPDTIPGNDYFKYQKRVDSNSNASTGNKTSDSDPVMASVKLRKNSNNRGRELVVSFKIHPGYHIYANVAGDDPYIKTDIKFDLPEGLKIGDWTASQPTQFGTTGTTIYEDKAEYVFPIIGDSTGPIKCVVSYQVCDNHICMPPAQKELQVVALR